MTAISRQHAGGPERQAHWTSGSPRPSGCAPRGPTISFSAARAAGMRRCRGPKLRGGNGIRSGGWVKTEEDPLDLHAGTSAHLRDGGDRAPRAQAVLRAEGAVLRYGALSGPGSHRRPGRPDPQAAVPARRQGGPGTAVGPPRRCGGGDGPGRRTARDRGVQHRRRRAGASQRMAALPREVCGCEATDAGPRSGWRGCWPATWRWR